MTEEKKRGCLPRKGKLIFYLGGLIVPFLICLTTIFFADLDLYCNPDLANKLLLYWLLFATLLSIALHKIATYLARGIFSKKELRSITKNAIGFWFLLYWAQLGSFTIPPYEIICP